MPDLLARLSDRPLVADGATGTELQKRLGNPGECYEALNQTHPDVVRDLAAAYAAAGSDIITTNSFGGSRLKLARVGLGSQARALSITAARLAREGAGSDVLIAGSMGSTGRLIEPLGDLSEEEAVECFSEQAAALAEGGADLILVETMMSLEEALAAVRGARQAADIPVACTFAFVMSHRTMFGVGVEDAVRSLEQAGAAAVGFNCGELTLESALTLVEEFAAVASVPVIAQPNAGLPELVAGETVFRETPESMGEYARRFVAAGAAIVGGCCGSTPEHIRSMVKALRP
ncbi:MAG TPA: homocysteine S-methyltransferase family protein [Armatimonadota bacterium]|nr:homocysteine S-methyltransferase family protein [Armatimonadota bacterium]HQK94514.1 homocysteine S-methyltransferase family protein [Armatimonadota bacterium]